MLCCRVLLNSGYKGNQAPRLITAQQWYEQTIAFDHILPTIPCVICSTGRLPSLQSKATACHTHQISCMEWYPELRWPLQTFPASNSYVSHFEDWLSLIQAESMCMRRWYINIGIVVWTKVYSERCEEIWLEVWQLQECYTAQQNRLNSWGLNVVLGYL